MIYLTQGNGKSQRLILADSYLSYSRFTENYHEILRERIIQL